MEKGHYGQYSGNARHSHKHHMVNSWEEEDVKRGRNIQRFLIKIGLHGMTLTNYITSEGFI